MELSKSYRKSQGALLFFALVAVHGLWLAGACLIDTLQEVRTQKPFLQITNESFSHFLWEHPEYMRKNQRKHVGYLPGFVSMERKVTPSQEVAEEYITAPPEIVYRYHLWHRYLSVYEFDRKIDDREFQQFLSYCQLKEIHSSEQKRAFIGWKNFFFEGEAINAYTPKDEEIEDFLQRYPNYTRNYWKNLYPNYLKGEIPPFLRVALYNDKMARLGQ